MKHLHPIVVLFFALAVSAGGALVAADSKPNIVFIMADDLGYGDVESFGGERCQIDTPGFDRLAREGMMFRDAHTVASVCVPARMAIMTGRYPWRYRRSGPDGPWGFLNPRLKTDEFTLGRLLQRAGYRTGYVGKWHLGTLMATKDGKNQGLENVDYAKPLRIGPQDYGFDESFILPGSLDMYPYAFVKNNAWVGEVTERRGWSAFHRVGPTAKGFEDYKVLDAFSEEAERYIAESAQVKNKPFFLYLALTSPHTPLSVSKRFEGKSRLGLYGDFVMETDHCVKRVLDALDKHKLADNTLVLATSDHGAAPYAGRKRKATPGQLLELEKDGHYSSGVFRGYKFSLYEGGLRVPLVARWPKTIKAGTRSDRLVGLIDLPRTLAEISGAKLTPGEAEDSISFLPLLKSPQAKAPRESMVLRSTRSFAFRSGPWKLALCPGSGCEGRFGNSPPRDKAWRDARQLFGRAATRQDLALAPFVQLFDLRSDPGETRNLASQMPTRVKELIAGLTAAARRPVSGIGESPIPNFFAGVPKFVFAE